MKYRSVRFLLAAACLLAASPWPAAAYVDVTPPTLGALCNDSVNIYVLGVEKASAANGVILFKCMGQLKGKPDPTAAKQVIPPAIAVGGEKQATATDVTGPKLILNWATEGKTAVLFTVTRGDDDPGGDVKGVGHAYIDNFWYTLSYDKNGKCWVAFKSELGLLTRYCGPADKLGDAVARILRGEEVVVPAMVGDNRQDLLQRRAKVQDLRASLQILNDNSKPTADKNPSNKPATDKKPEKPSDAGPAEKKPGKPADTTKPAGEKKPDKPADTKPADDKKPEKPADTKSADDKKPEKPGDTKPAEKPGDTKKPGDVKKPEPGTGTKPEAPKVVHPLPTRDPLPTIAAIDREIDRRLADAKVPASPRADDAEFLRRVTLDITGRIPTLERTRAFLDSNDPDKRRKLIDELLSSPEFGQHFATIWRNLTAARDIGEKKGPGGDSFTPWLAGQFNSRRGWNEIVYDLLTAEGNAATTPQTAYIMANSEMGQPRPNLLAASASRLFLGVQLQCAECHNHPFTSWKQADFWATAAFFGRVRNGGNKGGAQTINEVLDPQGQGGNKQPGGLKTTADGGIVIPGSAGKNAGQVVKARFLDGEQPVLDDKPLRPRFAAWATSADNKYFAPAFVNRAWGQFFGRGFVNPVDNFRDDQPASHPELLKLLADEFKASGHDVKHLIRCLCNSQAYQRTSKPHEDNQADAELFSHMTVKVLSSEAFLESLLIVNRGVSGGKTISRDQFLGDFRTQGAEGEFGHGIPQFLRRMNAQEFNGRFALVDQLAASGMSRDQVIESLYLATLSRRPTADEQRLMTDYLAKRNNPAGVLWILLNSGEFVLNH